MKRGQIFTVMKRLRYKPALSKAQFQAVFRRFIDWARLVAEARIIPAQWKSSLPSEMRVTAGVELVSRLPKRWLQFDLEAHGATFSLSQPIATTGL